MANDTCDIWKYWLMNKTVITNSVAALILVSSFIESPYQNILFNIGAFALSGSLTNNLAVYMLFEKIPLIYGCLLYTSPSPRDVEESRMPSSA